MIPNTVTIDTNPLANLGVLPARPLDRFEYDLSAVDKSFRRVFEAALAATEIRGDGYDSQYGYGYGGNRIGGTESNQVQMYDLYQRDVGFSGTVGDAGHASGVQGNVDISRADSGIEEFGNGDRVYEEIGTSGSDEPVETIAATSYSDDESTRGSVSAEKPADRYGNSETTKSGENGAETGASETDGSVKGLADGEKGATNKTADGEDAEDGSASAKSQAGLRNSRKSSKASLTRIGGESEPGDSKTVSMSAGHAGEDAAAIEKSGRLLQSASAGRNGTAEAVAALEGTAGVRSKSVSRSMTADASIDRINPESGAVGGTKAGKNAGSSVNRGIQAGGKGAEDGAKTELSRLGLKDRETRTTTDRPESADENAGRKSETIEVDLRENANRRSALGRGTGDTRTQTSEENAKESVKMSVTDLRNREMRSDAGTEEGIRISGRSSEFIRSQESGGTVAARNRNFQGTLLSQLRDELNGKIVKQAGVILKDGGTGEIRLNLKPEQLGNVRIRLEVKDSVIVGRIVVDNNTVREAFEQNLANLHRAFRDSGFESGGLDVHVSGGNQQEGRRSGGEGRNLQFTELFEEHGTTVELFERSAVDIMA